MEFFSDSRQKSGSRFLLVMMSKIASVSFVYFAFKNLSRMSRFLSCLIMGLRKDQGKLTVLFTSLENNHVLMNLIKRILLSTARPSRI